MKKAGFRVDIDTITDVTTGLISLKSIFDITGVRSSIYVNMGKSIDRIILLKGIGKTFKNLSGANETATAKIGVLKKLGKKNFIRTILFNPRIGPKGRDILLEMAEKGHEISLHGGKNHAVWQRNGANKSPEWTSKEIEWGKTKFLKVFGFEPKGFTAPGFVEPPGFEIALQKHGFRYHSDTCATDAVRPFQKIITNIPVNIVGLNTVPIIEYLVASGRTEKDIINQVLSEFDAIEKQGGIPVMYGHPTVEGLLFGELLIQVFESLKNNGWSIIPLTELQNEA